MEQPLASLRLDRNTLNNLKLLGYEYVMKNDLAEYFNKSEFENFKAPKTKNALDVYEEYSKSTIYTFIPDLDEILENEMIPGNIIELCGEAGSGKTQICFRLCINVQLPIPLGGRNGESLYICTNYNFSKIRLKEIANEMLLKLKNINFNTNLTLDGILSKITHIQINDYRELIAIVIYLKELLKTSEFRLIIIDSITILAQQIDYKERRGILFTLLGDLQKLAVKYNFVILLTNNVTLRNESSMEITKVPALGENFYHRINSRVRLKCLSVNYYKASLIKSGCSVYKESYFQF